MTTRTHLALAAASALLAAAFALPAPAERIVSDPEQLLTDAYVAVAKADTALDADDFNGAIALYSDALALYDDIARQFPTFKPSLVRYRNTYCQNQIADAQARVNGIDPDALPATDDAEPAAQDAAPAVPEPPKPPSATRRDARSSAEASMQSEYLNARIEALEKELASSDTLIDDLTAKNTALTTTTQQLADQVADL
ncbi:MAG: hypothetical protein J6Y19_08645, partial [Kiritimatiellae bacterium]|nr:hypothetical protein [Kiritimatiellia bacterium]